MSKKIIFSGILLGAGSLILLGFFLTNTAAAPGVKSGEWTMDYAAALKFAQEEKMPVLLNFTGSDWCGWCKLMQSSVFSQNQWKEYAQKKLVLVTLDFPRNQSLVPQEYVARNQQLQRQYGVQGYPTYIILDSDGKTILGKLGAGRDKTPQSFIEEVEAVIRLSASEIERFAGALSAEKAKAYRAAVANYKSIQKDLENWLNTQPLRTEENIAKYNSFLAAISKAENELNSFK